MKVNIFRVMNVAQEALLWGMMELGTLHPVGEEVPVPRCDSTPCFRQNLLVKTKSSRHESALPVGRRTPRCLLMTTLCFTPWPEGRGHVLGRPSPPNTLPPFPWLDAVLLKLFQNLLWGQHACWDHLSAGFHRGSNFASHFVVRRVRWSPAASQGLSLSRPSALPAALSCWSPPWSSKSSCCSASRPKCPILCGQDGQPLQTSALEHEGASDGKSCRSSPGICCGQAISQCKQPGELLGVNGGMGHPGSLPTSHLWTAGQCRASSR